jgi:uncharacterized protein
MDKNIDNSLALREIFSYFSRLWKNKRPLCKLFKTDTNYYLYDVGTNKIYKCNKLEYELINYLLTADNEKDFYNAVPVCQHIELFRTFVSLKKVVENENILLAFPAKQFGLGVHYSDLEYRMHNELAMIQLEVTEACNLRCRYCIYNPQYSEKRNHGTKTMTRDVAFRAIDYLYSHSNDKEKVSVTFYGGEPLLNFPLIKECLSYSKHVIKNKAVGYSITTNATLVNKQIAELLFINNANVLVSLDGPEEIHNSWRTYPSGTGSFANTLNGLRMLCEAFKTDLNRIGLSMVYTPPWSASKIERMLALWTDHKWLPKDIRVSITYPSVGTIPREYYDNIDQVDWSLYKWAKDDFLNSYRKKEIPHPIASSILEAKLAKLVQRPIYDRPLNKYCLNGCCVPAVRKLYVCADGNFRLCERIGKSPRIGNVFTGLDANSASYNYIERYEEASLLFCSNCWAIQLCNTCYQQSFYNGEIDIYRKERHCNIFRRAHENNLILYCTLIEQNEEGLDYLYDWEFN